MAHGQPDWGGASPTTITTSTPDYGELAARLKSGDTLNRQGNVVYLNDFSGGLNSQFALTNGASSLIQLSRKYHRGSGWSEHLQADGSAGAYAGFYQSQPFPNLGQIGAEFDVSFDANTQYLWVEIDVYAGTNLYQSAIRIDLVNHKLQYYDHTGAWVDLAAPVYPYPVEYMFHLVKLVIDVAGHKYVRLIVDDTTYAISDTLKTTATGVQTNLVNSNVVNYSKAGNVSNSYVGSFMFTLNEP